MIFAYTEACGQTPAKRGIWPSHGWQPNLTPVLVLQGHAWLDAGRRVHEHQVMQAEHVDELSDCKGQWSSLSIDKL